MAEAIAPEQADSLGLPQQLYRLRRQAAFMGGNGFHTSALHIADPFQKSRDTGHIVGTAFQPVRQHLRHGLQS